MASVEAATALLTAESIVVAALAVGLRQITPKGSLETDEVDFKMPNLIKFIGVFAFLLLGLSYAFSLAYLHTTEYPSGWPASFIGSRTYFDAALLTLALLVYLGMLGLYSMYYRAKMHQ